MRKNEWVIRDLKALRLNKCSLDVIERPHAKENNKSELEISLQEMTGSDSLSVYTLRLEIYTQ